MKLRILVAALLGTAVALVPVPASAKGPTEVEITGPGLEKPIHLQGAGDSRNPAGALTELTGVWLPFTHSGRSAFAAAPPQGDLGPRYVATFSTDFDDTMLRQELYPFAEGGPVVYAASGQALHGTETRYGGWRRADPALTDVLVSVGVPTGRGERWSTSRDREHGLSISYPPSWQPASSTVAPALMDPVVPLALGTYTFPTRGCGMAPGPALEALGPKDAFIAIYVGTGAVFAKTGLERPPRFGPELPWRTGERKCVRNVRGTVRTLHFEVGEQRLMVLAAIGHDVSARRENAVYRILDTLTVASPSSPPAPAG
ncbi:MAG: hypothetical protein ACRDY6_20390 [Acidimicrobiia bacterium]